MKKQKQFSKSHVIFANIIVLMSFLLSYTANFILSLLDKTQIEFSVPLAIVGAYAAFATGGYFTVAAIRDCSLNKNGMRICPENGKHYLENNNKKQESENLL